MALYSLEAAWHPGFDVSSANCRLDYEEEENKGLFTALFRHLQVGAVVWVVCGCGCGWVSGVWGCWCSRCTLQCTPAALVCRPSAQGPCHCYPAHTHHKLCQHSASCHSMYASAAMKTWASLLLRRHSAARAATAPPWSAASCC